MVGQMWGKIGQTRGSSSVAHRSLHGFRQGERRKGESVASVDAKLSNIGQCVVRALTGKTEQEI